jgi:hypothetical protein
MLHHPDQISPSAWKLLICAIPKVNALFTHTITSRILLLIARLTQSAAIAKSG